MPISFDLVRQQWQRKLIIVAAVAIGLGVIMGSRPISSEGNFLHEAVERSGVFLILIGILGRFMCSPRSPRLASPPSSAASCSPLSALRPVSRSSGLVVTHEEDALTQLFPGEFQAYQARVPRFLPDPWLWRDAETLLVRPDRVQRTFWDATLFLVAAGAMKGVETVRDTLPVGPFLHLY